MTAVFNHKRGTGANTAAPHYAAQWRRRRALLGKFPAPVGLNLTRLSYLLRNFVTRKPLARRDSARFRP
jgi:hypothetical protein